MEEDRAANRVRAQIDVRGKHHGTVDIFYGDDQIRFRHLSCERLKEKGTGADCTIHKNYNSWLANFSRDIECELPLAEDEASQPE